MSAVNRILFQQYPSQLRSAYAEVVRQSKLEVRHRHICHLGEIGLAHFSSLAFSDYRSQRHADPDPRVEELISRLSRISLGQYLEILRVSWAATQPSLFDVRKNDNDVRLEACEVLAAAVAGVEEAIDLNAGNLRRVVSSRLDQPRKKVRWLDFWGVFVEYRNRAEGHSVAHSWPVAHPHYYEIMTPLFEQAVVEALLMMQGIVSDYPMATLENIRYAEGAYVHTFAGEELGLPFTSDIRMDRSVTDLWARPEWSASTGRKFLLSRTSSGGYDVRALLYDLLKEKPPEALALQRDTKSTVAVKQPAKSSTSPWQSSTATAFGTCGELVQGVLPDGRHFHVTCPVHKSATVRVRAREAGEMRIEGVDSRHGKLHLSLLRTVEILNLGPIHMQVDYWSDLEVGKGMGSSTADILAAARALASATGHELDADQQAAIATSIESSDGTMYPGIVAFEQKAGRLLRRYEWWPQFVIAMVIPPNVFNTESADFTGKETLADEFCDILEVLDRAVADRDAMLFAAQATRSAELNQNFVLNPYFHQLVGNIGRYGAAGANVGHTGTMAGLLFTADSEGRSAAFKAVEDLRDFLPRDVRVEVTNTPASPI